MLGEFPSIHFCDLEWFSERKDNVQSTPLLGEILLAEARYFHNLFNDSLFKYHYDCIFLSVIHFFFQMLIILEVFFFFFFPIICLKLFTLPHDEYC